MTRLAIITVGKTHSGKTTFARKLESLLDNSVVLDQDNQAEFLNQHYKKLIPSDGPNSLKYAVSQAIAKHAIQRTDLHLIFCNSNISFVSRDFLLNTICDASTFKRILVYFDLSEEVLHERIATTTRGTQIFRRSDSTFDQVLARQVVEIPSSEEADHLLVIKRVDDLDLVMKQIVALAISR